MIPPAALVLLNGDVCVMNQSRTRAEAIAWRAGRLVAVGPCADVLAAAGPGADVWDSCGATVLPGFIDAHQHPALAMLYGGQLRLTPPLVTDIASLQAAIAAATRDLDPARPEEWLVAMDWDEMRLAERRPPSRAELDDAISDRPFMALDWSCHRAIANSRALELAGIGRHTPDPAGGIIGRGAGGLPNGLLIERGLSRVESLARASLVAHDAAAFLARMAAHHRTLAAAGVTLAVDAAVPSDLAALYREAARRGLLLVPTVLMPVSTAGWLEEPWDVIQAAAEEEPHELLLAGPLKLVFDGGTQGCSLCLSMWNSLVVLLRTWALCLRRGSLDPARPAFRVAPRLGRDLQVHTGIAIYQNERAASIVRAALGRGSAVAIHAAGNEAVAVALSAYEAAGAGLQRAGLPRLEHAVFLDQKLVTRIAGLGVAVVTQPNWLSTPAFASAPAIPGMRYMPLRWLLDAGVPVAGSSDYPCTCQAPLAGIRDAVQRRSSRGEALEPDQRIELHEALAMYTRTAAEVCGHGAQRGTLEVGKRADLVVLDGPLQGEGDLTDARVRATVIGGDVVFGRVGERVAA